MQMLITQYKGDQLRQPYMKKKQLIVLLTTIVSLFGQYWINAGKTSLKTTSEVAGREEVINYTLPPDFIFAIWGVIYLGILIYAFVGLSKKGSTDMQMNKTAYPVAISIFLNFLWTIVVGADLWLWAYPLQWLMLVISIVIMFRWDLHQRPLSSFQKYLSIPFALYAGWLTVAMIPFTSDLLNKSGWNYKPFTPTTWALILYVAACVIVLLAFRKLRQPFYLIPLVWALFGFFIRFGDLLQITAVVLAGLLFVIFLFQLPKFYGSRKR
jgi:hypothetical protein